VNDTIGFDPCGETEARLGHESERQPSEAPRLVKPPAQPSHPAVAGSNSVAQTHPIAGGIPGLAAQIQALFGNIASLAVSADDPALPPCFRQPAGGATTEPARDKIVALRCENGLTALVLTDPNQLERIQSESPALRSALITSWAGAFLFWIRTSARSQPGIAAWAATDSGQEVPVVCSGLIPLARFEPEAKVKVVREGKILPVRLADLRTDASPNNGAGDEGHSHAASKFLEGTLAGTQPNAPGAAADPVAELRGLFGRDRVLIDVSSNNPRLPTGLKGDAGAQAEWGPNQSSERRLIGVECGARGSDQLTAVIFHDLPSREDFLNRNPELRSGLRMTWSSSHILWIHVLGPAPRNLNAGPITWFANGIVPLVLQGQTRKAFVTQAGAIPTARFASIHWAPQTKSLFESDELEQLFGPALAPVQPKKFLLNDVHFSERLIRQLCLAYDPIAKVFNRYRIERDAWEEVSSDDLRRLITNGLVDIAAKFPEHFPASEINRQRVEHILWLLEMRSASCPGQTDSLERYFSEAVEASAKTELTSKELWLG